MDYPELLKYFDEHWLKRSTNETLADYPFDDLRALLAERGDPQRAVATAHITGSKGKGSTATLIAAILGSHGLRVGTFTSPHLVDVEERIRIGGTPIDRESFARYVGEEIAAARQRGDEARFIWRLIFVAALRVFRDRGVDAAAIEVGAGGRFDPTNIVAPVVACLTPISLEHVPRLGTTLAEIAAQKVAIVKSGSVAISAAQTATVHATIAAGAALAGAPLLRVGDRVHLHVHARDPSGTRLTARVGNLTVSDVHLPLLGAHQVENLAMALLASDEMLRALGRRLDPASTVVGVGRATWPGRLVRLGRDPDLLYDGAHTPESAAALAGALRDHFPRRRWRLVVGLVGRRDPGAFLAPLAAIAGEIVAVPVPGFDAVDPFAIAAAARAHGISSVVVDALEDALASGAERDVCVTGSLYLYARTLRYTGGATTLRG